MVTIAGKEAGVMKVEILKDTMAGREVARAGSVVSLEKQEAKYLISTGYAKEAKPNTILKRVSKPSPPVEPGKGQP